MRAHAGVEATSLPEKDGCPRTRISWLRSQAPLVFRTTREALPWHLAHWEADQPSAACVRLAAGAAGPLGGDQLQIDIRVGSGATLMASAVSATLLLPGPHGQESKSEVNITVATGGALVWLPGRQIAAAGCRHASVTRIDLEPGARLFTREEVLLGREGELPGGLRQRLRITHDGDPLYDQEVAVGAGAPGWSSSAVTGGRRSLGSIIVVDRVLEDIAAFTTAGADDLEDTAIMHLKEQAVVVASAAPDAIVLSRRLAAALAHLAPPSIVAG